jgi:DNA-binding MarR family transcriptional regulator
MYKPLDPLLHSQLRLAIISLLIGLAEAEFTYLKEKTGATSGNLSVQIDKLRQAGYIKVKKKFKDNYPLTLCSITEKGEEAFEQYVRDLKHYLEPKKKAG